MLFSVAPPYVSSHLYPRREQSKIETVHVIPGSQKAVAGNKTNFKFLSRLKITDLERTATTERAVLEKNVRRENLVIGAHETLTLRATIPRHQNKWGSELQKFR